MNKNDSSINIYTMKSHSSFLFKVRFLKVEENLLVCLTLNNRLNL